MLAKNILAILALALTVSASPLVVRQVKSSGNDGEGNQNVGNGGQNAGNGASNSGTINGDYTVEQATVTCGNAQLNCCNKVSKKGDTTNAGLLGSVFGSGDLDVQCSPLNIPIIGSMRILLVPELRPPNYADDRFVTLSSGSYQQGLRRESRLLPGQYLSGQYTVVLVHLLFANDPPEWPYQRWLHRPCIPHLTPPCSLSLSPDDRTLAAIYMDHITNFLYFYWLTTYVF